MYCQEDQTPNILLVHFPWWEFSKNHQNINEGQRTYIYSHKAVKQLQRAAPHLLFL